MIARMIAPYQRFIPRSSRGQLASREWRSIDRSKIAWMEKRELSFSAQTDATWQIRANLAERRAASGGLIV
jgi:hypothetical protein